MPGARTHASCAHTRRRPQAEALACHRADLTATVHVPCTHARAPTQSRALGSHSTLGAPTRTVVASPPGTHTGRKDPPFLGPALPPPPSRRGHGHTATSRSRHTRAHTPCTPRPHSLVPVSPNQACVASPSRCRAHAPLSPYPHLALTRLSLPLPPLRSRRRLLPRED